MAPFDLCISISCYRQGIARACLRNQVRRSRPLALAAEVFCSLQFRGCKQHTYVVARDNNRERGREIFASMFLFCPPPGSKCRLQSLSVRKGIDSRTRIAVNECRLRGKCEKHVSMCNDIPSWAAAAAKQHRSIQAPHAGSHFERRDLAAGGRGRFFEGWFLRAVLPSRRASFAFMHSIEESGQDGERLVVTQVLGPDEKLYVKRFLGGDRNWFASRNTLSFGNWEISSQGAGSPRELTAPSFATAVSSGFQVTYKNSVGRMHCVGPEQDEQWINWSFSIVPLLSWGNRGDKGRCTGTWLSYLPVFEPGYQVRKA